MAVLGVDGVHGVAATLMVVREIPFLLYLLRCQ